jgi:hypothetical protein
MTILAFPAHIEAIRTARAVLRSPDHHPIAVIDDACAAIERWSRDWADRQMARDVRRAMGLRAAAEVNADAALYGAPAPRRVATLDSLSFWASCAFVGFVGGFAVGLMLAIFVEALK